MLGLMALSTGVGSGLGLIDNERGTIWKDVALILTAGVALLAEIWTINRSASLGASLVVLGVVVISLATLRTIIVPIVMALVGFGVFMRTVRVGRDVNLSYGTSSQPSRNTEVFVDKQRGQAGFTVSTNSVTGHQQI